MGHARVVGGIDPTYGPYGLQAGIDWRWADPTPDRYAKSQGLLATAHYYNWTHTRFHDTRNVPMCWLPTWAYVTGSTGVLAKAKSNRARFWFVGNEPERADQSNTTPAVAKTCLINWHAQIGPRTIFPGVGWWDETINGQVRNRGREWLDQYIAAAGPRPYYWHVHFHGAPTKESLEYKCNQFVSWLKSKPAAYQRPFIVSEASGTYGTLQDKRNILLWYAKKLVSEPSITSGVRLRGVYWYIAYTAEPFWASQSLHNGAATLLTELGSYFRWLKAIPNPALESYPALVNVYDAQPEDAPPLEVPVAESRPDDAGCGEEEAVEGEEES